MRHWWLLSISEPRSPKAQVASFSKDFTSKEDAEAWMKGNCETAAIFTCIFLTELQDMAVIDDEVQCDVLSEWRWHVDFGFVPRRLWTDLHGTAPLDFDTALRIIVGLHRLGITTGVRYDGSAAYMEGLLLHAPYEWSGLFEPEVYQTLLHEGGRTSARIG